VRILAGKTGYTDIARYCLAIMVETPENRRLGMVFLGAEGRFTRFADVERVLQWMDQSKKNSPLGLDQDQASRKGVSQKPQTLRKL